MIRDEIEAALRESERRWRTVVTGAPVVLFALDANGVFTLSEGRGLEALGLTPGEVVGLSVFDVYAENREICDAARRALAGEAIHQEVEVSALTWELRYSPLEDEDGTRAGAIGVATNVTERRRLERQLEKTRRLESLGMLAGGIAHDFNNLLTAILGNTALALTRLPPGHTAGPLLERAEEAANRAAELTAFILAASGRGAFTVEPIDPGTLLDELRAELEAEAPDAVVLHVDRPATLPLIPADRGRVREVVRHLVRNACESCAPGPGTVAIRLRVRDVEAADLQDAVWGELCDGGRFFSLEVTDDGRGMDEATLARVFDPFFSTKAQGRGLGLAAVLGIIRGHGGAVLLRSESGSGTTVEALFPLSSDVSGMEEEPVDPTPQGSATKHILVVDDHDAVRDMASLTCQAVGYEALEAESGEAALEVYEKRAADIALVLLDFRMPGMSGEATFRALRKKDADLAIVVMSGDTRDEAREELKGAPGAFEFLQKPFGVKELQKKLAEVLR